MFLDFYRLCEQPFNETPDPRFVYPSATHREALASLFYGIETGRGFLALIAEPGMGKTTLLFHLLEQLRSSSRTAFLFQTQCDSRELLRSLLADLGIDTQETDLSWMHEQLKRVLISEASVGRRLVVFIDEAQNLTESALETVRLLSDFETPTSKLMQIVLAGQPQLADKLARPTLAQLRQRVSILCRLNPFTPAETDAYINHRLRVAGYEGGPLFTPDARAMIEAQSKGIPRNINNLCFNALSLGYALGKKEIDSSLVREVANDLEVSPLGSDSHPLRQTVAAGSLRAPLHGHGACGKIRAATPASTHVSRSASTPASIPATSATRPDAPAAAPPLPEAFWASSFPTELMATTREAAPQSTVLPTTVTASPVRPTTERTKAEPMKVRAIHTPGDRHGWSRQLLDTTASTVQALRENAPLSSPSYLFGSRLESASRTRILVGVVVVVLFVVCAAGFFFLRRASAQPPATTQTNSAPVASPVSTTVNTAQRLHSASNRAPVASRPGSHEPSARNPAWVGAIPNGKVFASLAATLRSAAAIGPDAPPDLPAVALDGPADAIQRALPASANILPTLARPSEQTAPVLVGGRVKEPQLVSKILANYPPAAKRIGLEGNVVIDTVIDTTGNLTKIKVVSGPALLQDAAVDSVRMWKYEPSYLDDKLVPVEMFITVEFRLR